MFSNFRQEDPQGQVAGHARKAGHLPVGCSTSERLADPEMNIDNIDPQIIGICRAICLGSRSTEQLPVHSNGLWGMV